MALAPIFNRQLGFSNPFQSVFDPIAHWNSLLDDHHSRQLAKEVSAVANARIDWCETPQAHVLKADLPGLTKEEIKIQVEDNKVLQISGERNKEESQKTDKWHRVERAHGGFRRRFRLPEDAMVDQISAKVENGVLTVNVPKMEQHKSDGVKSIDVK